MLKTFTSSRIAGCLLGLALASFAPAYSWADQPGRGLTGPFEVEFMKLTIDHHFTAMRMTELAAATDLQRNGPPTASEGTAPTPGFPSVQAKAALADLKSLARRNNRMQREEIMMLQGLLRDWYGVKHEPRIRADGRILLGVLEKASPGKEFDHAFYEAFSRHHFTLLQPVNGCLTGSELRHTDLRRLCNQMWHSQTSDIDDMRHQLQRHFNIADYQPFKGKQPLNVQGGAPRGQHSGPQP